jgi:hypothetical protein
MARRIVLSDDLDNTESTEDNPVLTWQFGFGPSNNFKRYTIDLTTENYEKLQDALKRFINVATEVEDAPAPPTRVASPRSASARPKADREQLDAIRQWARSKGYEVAERGRIKQSIVDEYNAAH